VNDELKFYAYRYFIIPSEVSSIFQMLVHDKDVLINDIFFNLEKSIKMSKIINNRKLILCFNRKIGDSIYILKFAKEKRYTRYEEGDNDIEDTKDSDYPFIYVIVDIKRHVILIQQKSSVYSNVTTAINKLREWLITGNEMYDYQLKIDEITHEHIFWEYVDKSDELYEIFLRMKSPNIFDGFLEANTILKKIREILNNTETNIKFMNEKGKLQVNRNVFDTFIKYITGGGGEWKLKVLHDGAIKTPKSKDNKKSVLLSHNDENELNASDKMIKMKLDEVDEIMKEGNGRW
jgi:hypothetical protein